MSSPDTAAGPTASPRADRLLIVDDDVCFGALISAVARSRGFEPRSFQSLVDMGSFARIREYDVAVIDYYLGNMRGDEIAEYVDTFFSDMPVIIVSSEDFGGREGLKWPASVRRFVPKTSGPDQIIATARAVLDRERMLRHFATYREAERTRPTASRLA